MKKSFIKKTWLLLSVQMLLLCIGFGAYTGATYAGVREEMSQSSENFINLFGQQLDHKLEQAEGLLVQLVYDNSDYIMLQSPQENERYYATMSIFKFMKEIMADGSLCDALAVVDNSYDTRLVVDGSALDYATKEAIADFLQEHAKTQEVPDGWQAQSFQDTWFVYRIYIWNGRAAGVFLKADNLMSETKGYEKEQVEFALKCDEEVFWGRDFFEDSKKKIYKERELFGEHLILCTNTTYSTLASQVSGNRLMILGLLLITMIYGALIIQSIYKEILVPMGKFQENMQIIEAGNYTHRVQDSFPNREFEQLKRFFNSMLDEIVGLKIRSYEKQIELSESELKSIRLQIRPHFFLNAMTTISSLSMQGKNQEIKTYIDALSKNIRYMFKSGLHTVEIQEELRHVENYFEMQELKYPGCVFYFISIEEDCKDWKIPQMLIHTVIENEYKYAVSVDSMLTILIKISKAERDNQEVLCIEIEDDGKGYPKDVLQDFAHVEAPAKDGNRLGLYSLRKMLKIMYEKEDLFEIDNIAPHGCINRFYIPKHALHEVKTDKTENKLE